MVEWVPAKIPKELMEKIQNLLKDCPMWINEHEFVRDAIRDKIEAIKAKRLNLEERPLNR